MTSFQAALENEYIKWKRLYEMLIQFSITSKSILSALGPPDRGLVTDCIEDMYVEKNKDGRKETNPRRSSQTGFISTKQESTSKDSFLPSFTLPILKSEIHT